MVTKSSARKFLTIRCPDLDSYDIDDIINNCDIQSSEAVQKAVNTMRAIKGCTNGMIIVGPLTHIEHPFPPIGYINPIEEIENRIAVHELFGTNPAQDQTLQNMLREVIVYEGVI